MSNMTKPAVRVIAITPNDTNDFETPYRALWVNVAGALAIIAEGDTIPVTLTVPAGALPISVKRVLATGTTATGLFGLR